MNQQDEYRNELIEGRNAVIEAIRAGRAIDKIYCAKVPRHKQWAGTLLL